jgi:phospholipid-binding lipoprotein MlaA
MHWLIFVALLVPLIGCSTVQAPSPQDPWEGFNRSVYTFNDKLDRAVLRPIATGYTKVVPQPVQNCIHNIFNNLQDVWSAANSLLQGHGPDFINTCGRVLFNTTVGIGGCFDVASTKGVNRIPNDFGTTLGVWGIGQGPYLVLPLWGASTLRDSVGLVGDGFSTSAVDSAIIKGNAARNTVYGLNLTDRRANLLDASKTLDQIALDPYSFIRDAYLQRRAAMVEGENATLIDNLPDYQDEEDDNS